MTQTSVTLALSQTVGRGFRGPFPLGQSILWTLLDARVRISYACMDAVCGQDLIRVVKGSELLNETGPHERHTLDTLGAEAGCRLACQCQLADGVTEGEIVVEFVND